MARDLSQKLDTMLVVQQGQPNSSQGNELEERWCWVDGKGLFHVKKYNGQWNFRYYDSEPLTLKEEIDKVGNYGEEVKIITITTTALNLNYADINNLDVDNININGDTISSDSDINLVPSGSNKIVADGSVIPETNNSESLGKLNNAWKSLVLYDQSNSKYYDITTVNGVLTATEL